MKQTFGKTKTMSKDDELAAKTRRQVDKAVYGLVIRLSLIIILCGDPTVNVKNSIFFQNMREMSSTLKWNK
jgi:hypothetical protein